LISFWLFRSDIKHLEYYHEYKDLETFEKKCHDFYLLQCIWFLRNGYFDEVVIWRLSEKPIKDIIFEVNGKLFIQRWVTHLSETLKYPKPTISFWRGGFQIYDIITRNNPEHFGMKFYLGAGKRIFPQWQGKYDIFLVEDERDIDKHFPCLPFYKTASPYIFHPIENSEIKYDICWPCNFTQASYKGQELFISIISKTPLLRDLSIVHCGNKPIVGYRLCKKYNVKNIEFKDLLPREEINLLLNKSKFGLNMSNLYDGSPRVSTEILMSGTPLFIRDTVRILSFYKQKGVVEFNEGNCTKKILSVINNYNEYRNSVNKLIKNDLSFESICKKNIHIWGGLL